MIEFKNVSKTYDNGTEALKDVNIKINDGEFVFVVGSSGSRQEYVSQDNDARAGA